MNERQRQKTTQSIIKKGLIILFVLLIILGFAGYRYVSNGLKPMDAGSEEIIEVEIPTGSSRSSIARILAENELINSPFIFDLYVRFSGENSFQAGSYLMSQSMSVDELVHYLSEGGTPIMNEPLEKLTIPEGIQLDEIANRVAETTDYSAEEFMELIQDVEFIDKLGEAYPDLLTDTLAAEDTRFVLEGYLFPATYEVYYDTTLEELVEQMIAQMNQVVAPYYEEIATGEYNVHEILTLASYIEREGVSLEDRKLISGVFYNRLEINMPLQTDPSVAYALGEHRERTSYVDLEVDSPFNTYMYPGVGAGPINSPSADAIEAAVYPDETDYFYFLADLSTGNIYYSETYEQHLEYQNKYLRNND